jgi:hypothetical protein
MGLAVVVALVAVAYAMRSNPIGPVAGRQLSGTVVAEPVTDWSFTDEHQTIAIETRPAAPHSVTVICFTHEGNLYVPAQGGSEKSWPYYALADPRVRVRVGDRIYPARATRVTDESLIPAMREAGARKYDFAPEPGTVIEDIWLFRIDSAIDVAAGSDLRGFTIRAEE